MRRIWTSFFRSDKKKPKVDPEIKYLPCHIYASPMGFLWEVTHHGRIVAKGRSRSFNQATIDAAKAIAPTKIVIGSTKYDEPRDR